MLPEGRAYSRLVVRPSVRLSHVCPEHISKSTVGNLMKLDTLKEGNEGNCRMQEPKPYHQYLWSYCPSYFFFLQYNLVRSISLKV